MSSGSPGPLLRAPDPRLCEVADGVFAHIQPYGGWCLSNAGVILGPEGPVMVDTAATRRRAEALRDTVLGLSNGSPRLVVNTHHHGDHAFGNDVFAPATVVAHERCRTEMAETGLSMTALWPHVDWGPVTLRLPTVTYRDRMTLHRGNDPVELIHVGPAHTTNDTVVWLPAQRVLFAGDVVFNGCTPFVLMGSVRGTLRALETLRALGPYVVVGGHGEIGGTELFDATAGYLRWLDELARRGRAAGLSPVELAHEAGPPPQEGLLDPERLVANLHRAYDELAGGELGRPLDPVAIFAEMVEFNGGVLPTCLA